MFTALTINAPQPLRISVDARVRFEPVATLASGMMMPIPPAAVMWSSSNPAIASVAADGWVTGLRAGTVTITGQAGGRMATVMVTVYARVLTGVALGDVYRSIKARPRVETAGGVVYRSVKQRPRNEWHGGSVYRSVKARPRTEWGQDGRVNR